MSLDFAGQLGKLDWCEHSKRFDIDTDESHTFLDIRIVITSDV